MSLLDQRDRLAPAHLVRPLLPEALVAPEGLVRPERLAVRAHLVRPLLHEALAVPGRLVRRVRLADPEALVRPLLLEALAVPERLVRPVRLADPEADIVRAAIEDQARGLRQELGHSLKGFQELTLAAFGTRLQIVTVGDIFEGKLPKLPPQEKGGGYKQAPTEKPDQAKLL